MTNPKKDREVELQSCMTIIKATLARFNAEIRAEFGYDIDLYCRETKQRVEFREEG